MPDTDQNSAIPGILENADARDLIRRLADEGILPTFDRLMLEFDVTGNGLDALVSLRGAVYRLPYTAPEPGLAQIVWSDGERSLTWLPGVRLMWMASETHLMCGRGGHKH